MSTFPFLHVDNDFLRPPRRSNFPFHLTDFEYRLIGALGMPLPPIIPLLPALIRRGRIAMSRTQDTHDLISLHVNETDPIFEAVKQNDPSGLMRVLKKRKRQPVPLSVNSDLWTALHLAASKSEYRECLELLLRYDSYSILVQRDSETLLGETALHIACEQGCPENVLLLLRKGCDAKKKTKKGRSALHIAASIGNVQILRYLLSYDVDINVTDTTGNTPLHLSVMADHLETTGILIANGANIMALDNKRNIPLHLACRYGTFEIACLLLEDNAESLNSQNSSGKTPFMYAISHFDVGCVRYLLEKGARTDIRDERGRMALHFAASLGRCESFACLLRSTDVTQVEQNWLSTTAMALKREPVDMPYKFDSFTCMAIPMGLDHLTVLLESLLPLSILQMPSLRQDYTIESLRVFSPLAYLFLHFLETENTDFAFEKCLDLMIDRGITKMAEFQSVFLTEWPEQSVQFINPLSMLMCSTWPHETREHYFNLLIDEHVTTDYCLECYHDNSQQFDTFNKYKLYYGLVIYAVEKYNLEVVKLLISNSVILEPDILCNYLIMAFTKKRNPSSSEEEEARNLYQYLINLKPVYYKWYQPLKKYDLQSIPFMPAAELIADEALAKFCGTPYNFQRSPIFAVTEEFRSPLHSDAFGGNALQQFPYISAAEEFANVKLQQLCRTVIRQQLRGPTLQDNLCNFGEKIKELPIPNILNDFLVFKK